MLHGLIKHYTRQSNYFKLFDNYTNNRNKKNCINIDYILLYIFLYNINLKNAY